MTAPPVVPWTREQIEAWVSVADARSEFPPRFRAIVRRTREAIVRLCPEATDYEQLRKRLGEVEPRFAQKYPEAWALITDADIDAIVADAVAALWSRSLSESRSDDAHEEHLPARGAAPEERSGTPQ